MSGSQVEFPGGDERPFRAIGQRVLIALALLLFVAVLTYAGRGGYVDPEDGSVSVLDALYYSTVSVTTTTATSAR